MRPSQYRWNRLTKTTPKYTEKDIQRIKNVLIKRRKRDDERFPQLTRDTKRV
jgi:hypothetical protein